jgi:3-oxoacyl-[acyl-carrier protein] reductase
LNQDDRRVAMVTGGSRGLGAAIVRQLAVAGWDISFCHHHDEQAASQVEKAVCDLGVRVTAVEVDVTHAAQVSAWFRQTENELGLAGAMVSCAGITRHQPLTRVVDADWRAVIDTGLRGVFHLCRAAMVAMMKRRSGRIVMVSSVCAAYDHSAPGHDATTRPGMAGFVTALADQVARFGINVNAVTPGPLSHDMTAILPDKNRATLTETITLRRFGDAADVAALVAFLLSEAADDITGRVLEVRGAISLSLGPVETARVPEQHHHGCASPAPSAACMSALPTPPASGWAKAALTTARITSASPASSRLIIIVPTILPLPNPSPAGQDRGSLACYFEANDPR